MTRRGGELVGYTQRRTCGICGAVGHVTYEPGEPRTWDYPGSAPAVGAWGCAHAEAMLGEWGPDALLAEAADRQAEAWETAAEAAVDRWREEGRGARGDGRRQGARGDRWDD